MASVVPAEKVSRIPPRAVRGMAAVSRLKTAWESLCLQTLLNSNVSCSDPYDFQGFVWNHFERQGYNVVSLSGNGGRPDVVLVTFFGLHRTIIDAKAKERLSYGDIDQVARYVRKFRALGGGRIYVCHDTHVGPEQAKYAYDEDIQVFRLGRNGRETELNLHQLAYSEM